MGAHYPQRTEYGVVVEFNRAHVATLLTIVQMLKPDAQSPQTLAELREIEYRLERARRCVNARVPREGQPTGIHSKETTSESNP